MTNYRRDDGRVSKTYNSWCAMRARCNNPKKSSYKDYGGRGITVCERWNFFAYFLLDMGECPEGMSLDRKDNNGNYEPGNCRWATPTEQMQNSRSITILTYNGESHSMIEWSKITGLPYGTICGRIFEGWTAEQTLTIPNNSRLLK